MNGGAMHVSIRLLLWTRAELSPTADWYQWFRTQYTLHIQQKQSNCCWEYGNNNLILIIKLNNSFYILYILLLENDKYFNWIKFITFKNNTATNTHQLLNKRGHNIHMINWTTLFWCLRVSDSLSEIFSYTNFFLYDFKFSTNRQMLFMFVKIQLKKKNDNQLIIIYKWIRKCIVAQLNCKLFT